MNKQEYVYSFNSEEFYTYDEFLELIPDDTNLSDTIEYYRGSPKRYTHSDFINSWCVESMVEYMSDEVFEQAVWVEDYPELNADQLDSLREHIIRWFDKNIPQPKFFTVDKSEYVVQSYAELLGQMEIGL